MAFLPKIPATFPQFDLGFNGPTVAASAGVLVPGLAVSGILGSAFETAAGQAQPVTFLIGAATKSVWVGLLLYLARGVQGAMSKLFLFGGALGAVASVLQEFWVTFIMPGGFEALGQQLGAAMRAGTFTASPVTRVQQEAQVAGEVAPSMIGTRADHVLTVAG